MPIAIFGMMLVSEVSEIVFTRGFPRMNFSYMRYPVISVHATSLFYYLVESAGDPQTDPLIWWMNGGPGASSFAGLFGENGPLLLNATGQLTPNPYSWNRHANVLVRRRAEVASAPIALPLPDPPISTAKLAD